MAKFRHGLIQSVLGLGLLFSAFPLSAQSRTDPSPPWFLFFEFTESENLCGVTWHSMGADEERIPHGLLIAMPSWILESQGRLIESKSSNHQFHYLFLPASFNGFCQQYKIDTATLPSQEGKPIIDLAPFSTRFSPIPPAQIQAILKQLEAWNNREDWTVHPRPEPQPPKWLNRPLNRKFYYEVPE